MILYDYNNSNYISKITLCKYLKAVQEGNEIIILKGKEVARLISKTTGISFLTDSLTGILKRL